MDNNVWTRSRQGHCKCKIFKFVLSLVAKFLIFKLVNFDHFKPASFQEKGFIVLCESVCPDVCCRRSEDTGRKVTFST